MNFGVSFQSHIQNSWKHAVLAEQMGFTNAWFVDTQMLASDVYACMTLAAEHTSTIQLGTAVAIAGTRIAPVTAHIDRHGEPTRTRPDHSRASGLATLPGAPWACRPSAWIHSGILSTCVENCCAEKQLNIMNAGRHSRIRFLDREHGYINVNDPVPIYLAASYPKALALAGELGDGLITVSTITPDALTATLEKAAKGRPQSSEATQRLSGRHCRCRVRTASGRNAR